MRVLALDMGRRRVGLAISDPSGLLARPLRTITVTDSNLIETVVAEIQRLVAEDDGLGEVVIGLPRHLDGTPSDQTAIVERFVNDLRKRLQLPIVTEDERLSSREAESTLARSERDWRKRKVQLDAAAAAVILQDYLDRRNAAVARLDAPETEGR
jgi:putative Holliday junction resolvase